MKDPAFLFYPNDWLGGTMGLTRHQKGCYFDLLIAQFNSGPLSLETIKVLLGPDFGAWPNIRAKFKQDAQGHFFNERLEAEKIKRKAFARKQTERILKRWNKNSGISRGNTAVLPIENENENKNEDVKLKYKPHVRLKKEEYEKLCAEYGTDTANAAIEYLDMYKQEKNYKTNSDYLSIRRWVIEAVNKTKKYDTTKPAGYLVATDGTKIYEKDIDFTKLG